MMRGWGCASGQKWGLGSLSFFFPFLFLNLIPVILVSRVWKYPSILSCFPSQDQMEGIFGNSSSAHTTRWEPEPTRRDTYGILMSCTITLGLCVWTAVHLNVPSRDERPWYKIANNSQWKWLSSVWPWNQWSWPGQTLRKTAWTIFGILAPEIVRSPLLEFFFFFFPPFPPPPPPETHNYFF